MAGELRVAGGCDGAEGSPAQAGSARSRETTSTLIMGASFTRKGWRCRLRRERREGLSGPEVMRFRGPLPFHELQVEDEDDVEHLDQQQLDEGRQREAADLRVAERLPERPPVNGER